eukprot:jgi/Mesvir1/27070/Mv20763-RA.1
MGSQARDVKLPEFYNYPPYFTLQPVQDTRERQVALWKSLILSYCRELRIFSIDVDTFPLFSNGAINRKLTNEARVVFLDALVAEGYGEWVGKGKVRCLVLWKKVPAWADDIYTWVRANALEGTVMIPDEIISGVESKGQDFHGMHRDVLLLALQYLEGQRRVELFKGATSDDLGVKFLK